VMEANASRGQDRIELGSGTYTLTLKGNEDKAVSGDLDVLDEVAIVGTAGTVISAGEIGERVFDLSPTGDPVDLELRNLTVRDGRGPDGGGIRSRGRLHLVDVVVRDNYSRGAGAGGGIFNNDGFVELHGSELRDNKVESDLAASGGGLQSQGASAAVFLRGSSVTGNYSGLEGGGVAILEGSLDVRDSTIADNKARRSGGGLHLNDVVRARLRNVTITGNQASYGNSIGAGGGIHRGAGSGSLRLANTIVAENLGEGNVTDDCNGTITSHGFNLFGSGDGCNGIDLARDQAGTAQSKVDPKLEALGGAPRSRTPQPGSPAIGAGNPDALNDERIERCTHVDQRGVERPKGPLVDGRARCDVGAVERE